MLVDHLGEMFTMHFIEDFSVVSIMLVDHLGEMFTMHFINIVY